jgi:hypothetical protein
VHARRELVVDTKVALRVFADFDDVLRHRLAADELSSFVQPKREGNLGLTLHRLAFVFLMNRCDFFGL